MLTLIWTFDKTLIGAELRAAIEASVANTNALGLRFEQECIAVVWRALTDRTRAFGVRVTRGFLNVDIAYDHHNIAVIRAEAGAT